MNAPHALTVEGVAAELAGDLQHGLSETDAAARLARFGPNKLARPHRPAFGAIALRQFADPLVGLLVGAALVSALIGERIEAAAIAAIVLLNALLGFVQEARAEGAVLALRDVLERRAIVIRGDVSARSASKSSFQVTSSLSARANGCRRTHGSSRLPASLSTSRP